MAREIQANQGIQGNQEIEARGKEAVSEERTRPGWVFRPDVDIVEHPDEYVVSADMPGVDEGAVRVELKEGVLSIDASLAVEPDPSWTPLYTEYRLGGYHREFTMSDRIEGSKIEGHMKNGVLELHLPKAASAQPRRIEIRPA